jgi:uncharacterized protein (UPF0261 family)
MSVVLLVGTLDTKGPEIAFARDRLKLHGFNALVIDVGSGGPPTFIPDIALDEVLAAAGADPASIADRGQAVAAATLGIATLVAQIHAQTPVAGILGLGGSAGTTIGTAAMRALPFGIPKVMVSTLASGQTRPYVQGSDIALFASVADIAGLNRVTRAVIANASAALAGMVRERDQGPGSGADHAGDPPLITATMFGVTTSCVQAARAILEDRGYEVMVFHATGVGGQAMEGLIRDGQVQGVLDLTTTELADELVGGVLSAGPDRLLAAARSGTPQVVSLGALDMVNFGPMESVPERFRGRKLHAHNPTVTLMRTTAEECARLGERIALALREATGPTAVLVPRGGLSALDAPGQPFHDPEADQALFEALAEGLTSAPNSNIRLIFRDEHVNDPAFARAAAEALLGLLPTRRDDRA